jgi:hypothetical protein
MPVTRASSRAASSKPSQKIARQPQKKGGGGKGKGKASLHATGRQAAPSSKPPSDDEDDDDWTDGDDTKDEASSGNPVQEKRARRSLPKKAIELPADLLPRVHQSLKPHGFRYRSEHPTALAFDQVIPVRVFAADQAYTEEGEFANGAEVETTYIETPESPRNPLKPDLYL